MKNIKQKNDSIKKVAIIGGGVSGLATGIFLSWQGFEVYIFEKSSDSRMISCPTNIGRSVNFTVAARGEHALKKLKVFDTIKKLSVPLNGRIIHKKGVKPKLQPYGINANELLRSITRKSLIDTLLNLAEESGVKIFFNHTCEKIIPEDNFIEVFDQQQKLLKRIENITFCIGADGAFSSVRNFIHQRKPTNFNQKFSEFFYKEILVPTGAMPFSSGKNLYICPCENGVIVATPNMDQSFTINLILSMYGAPSLESLNTQKAVENFFEANAPEFLKLDKIYIQNIARHRPNSIVINKTDSWYYKDKIVLIGDACHAVSPFLGQGMNSALEDSVILTQIIKDNPNNLEKSFELFQKKRKKDTDILAEFSYNHLKNFGKISRLNTFKMKVNHSLQKILGEKWLPLYTMITHTTIPYSEILPAIRLQKIILIPTLFIYFSKTLKGCLLRYLYAKFSYKR